MYFSDAGNKIFYEDSKSHSERVCFKLTFFLNLKSFLGAQVPSRFEKTWSKYQCKGKIFFGSFHLENKNHLLYVEAKNKLYINMKLSKNYNNSQNREKENHIFQGTFTQNNLKVLSSMMMMVMV